MLMPFLDFTLSKMVRLIGACLLLTVWLCSPASSAVILYDDMEDAPNLITTYGVSGAGGGNSLTVSTEQARAGSSSYKFVLAPAGTPNTDSNVELILRGLECTPQLRNFDFGVEYWMAYSLFIPADFQYPNRALAEWALLAQFHAATELCDGVTNPPVAFFVNSTVPGFQTVIRGRPEACSNGIAPTNSVSYNAVLTKGIWHDIVLNFKFHYLADQSPFFKMWVNGTLVVNRNDINAHNDAKSNYFKMGIYGHSTYPTIVYYDEFKVGDAASSYAEIAPGGTAPTDPLTITTATLGTFTQNSTSTGTLAASGGVSPYTWSSANKPDWFTLTAATGAWLAAPTAGGTYAFTITCTDDDLNVVNKTFSGTITEVSAPTLPEVTAFVMPDTSTTLEVPVTTFTGISGTVAYIVTESPAKPVVSDPGWSASAPASATASDDGTIYFYGYVKDGDGVISVGDVEAVDITIDDSVITGWTETAISNVWSASCGITALSVYFDAVKGIKRDVLVDISMPLDWYYSSGTLYIYSTTDPDTAYTTITASTDVTPDPVTPAEGVITHGGDKIITTGGERIVNIRSE